MTDMDIFLGKPVNRNFSQETLNAIENKLPIAWTYDWCEWSLNPVEQSVTPPPVEEPPVITLASPQAWNYEEWQSIWPVTLNATTNPGTWAPITSVTFSRWGSVIHTVPAPVIWWGSESYVDAWPFTSNTTFQANVVSWSWTDNSPQVRITFQPRVFRWFNPNASLTETEIESLNYNRLSWGRSGNYSFPDTVPSNYKYLCYPTRYWDLNLSSIPWPVQDPNWFDVPVNLIWVVSLTNWFWFTEDYNVYRSVFQLGWSDTWTVN